MKAYWRNAKEALTDAYFWTWALPFLTLVIVGMVALYMTMGFNRSYQLSHFSGNCRSLTDPEALAMLLMLFISTAGNLLTLGEMFIYVDKKRQKIKVNYLSLSIVACIAVLSTVLTLVMANFWCH
jgi:hypothetical protein